MHLIVDSTGLQIVGDGPWAAAKHGTEGTREWRRFHIGVDLRGFIVAHSLTESCVDDASIVPDLLNQVSAEVDRFTGDGAYDTIAIYEAFAARGATVVVPPIKNARTSTKDTAGTRARKATVNSVRELGRRQWKKQSGYHQQAKAENAFFRYKQIIGGQTTKSKSPNSGHRGSDRNQRTQQNARTGRTTVRTNPQSRECHVGELCPEGPCNNAQKTATRLCVSPGHHPKCGTFFRQVRHGLSPMSRLVCLAHKRGERPGRASPLE